MGLPLVRVNEPPLIRKHPGFDKRGGDIGEAAGGGSAGPFHGRGGWRDRIGGRLSCRWGGGPPTGGDRDPVGDGHP